MFNVMQQTVNTERISDSFPGQKSVICRQVPAVCQVRDRRAQELVLIPEDSRVRWEGEAWKEVTRMCEELRKCHKRAGRVE